MVVKDLVGYVRTCAINLQEIKNLERCPLVIDDGDESNVREALIIEVNDTYFYVTEFLNVLYNFAISDEIKYDIYEHYQMKLHLDVLIENGNSTEREYALKLLWQLCFDQRVARAVANNDDIMDTLNEFKNLNESPENEKLIKNSTGILWLMDKFNSENVKIFFILST